MTPCTPHNADTLPPTAPTTRTPHNADNADNLLPINIISELFLRTAFTLYVLLQHI